MLANPACLDVQWGQQCPEEFRWLLSQVTDGRSVLEIGSCHGQTLREFAAAGFTLLRSIDLGTLPEEARHFAGADVSARLCKCVETLRMSGLDAEVLIANSHDPASVRWAAKWLPYDLVFIDGDHTYDGAMQDWLQYGQFGRIVAFHDVGGVCADLWNEIKAGNLARTDECIVSPMGIGIVRME